MTRASGITWRRRPASAMAVACVAAVLVVAPRPAAAADVFVSPTGDDDSGDGSEGKPFGTVGRALDDVTAGDSVVLRAGDYHEAIKKTGVKGEAGKPITIRAFEGEMVKFDGTVAFTESWTKHEDKVWKAVTTAPVFGIFVDGMPQHYARWPDLPVDEPVAPDGAPTPKPRRRAGRGGDDEGRGDSDRGGGRSSGGSDGRGGRGHGGHTPADAPTTAELFDLSLWAKGAAGKCTNGAAEAASTPHDLAALTADITGANVVINTGGPHTYTTPLTTRDAAAFTYEKVAEFGDGDANHFFFEGTLSLLDAAGEFFFHTNTSTAYLWAESSHGPQGDVRLQTQELAIDARQWEHVSLVGLNFFATAVQISNSSAVTVERCRFDRTGLSRRTALGPKAAPPVLLAATARDSAGETARAGNLDGRRADARGLMAGGLKVGAGTKTPSPTSSATLPVTRTAGTASETATHTTSLSAATTSLSATVSPTRGTPSFTPTATATATDSFTGGTTSATASWSTTATATIHTPPPAPTPKSVPSLLLHSPIGGPGGFVVRDVVMSDTSGQALVIDAPGAAVDPVVEDCSFTRIDWTATEAFSPAATVAITAPSATVQFSSVKMTGAANGVSCTGPLKFISNTVANISKMQSGGAMVDLPVAAVTDARIQSSWFLSSPEVAAIRFGATESHWGTGAAVTNNVVWGVGGALLNGDDFSVFGNTAISTKGTSFVLPDNSDTGSFNNNKSFVANNAVVSISSEPARLEPVLARELTNFDGDVAPLLQSHELFDFRPLSTAAALIDVGSLLNDSDYPQPAGVGKIDIGAYDLASDTYSIPGRRDAAASHPIPTSGSRLVTNAPALMWRPARGADRETVMFGRYPFAMEKVADVKDGANIVAILDNVPDDFAVNGSLTNGTWLWRVDSVAGGATVTGPVWSLLVGDGIFPHRTRTMTPTQIESASTPSASSSSTSGGSIPSRTDAPRPTVSPDPSASSATSAPSTSSPGGAAPEPGGLSGGAVAGIVICVILLLCGGAAVAILFLRRRRVRSFDANNVDVWADVFDEEETSMSMKLLIPTLGSSQYAA